MWSPRCEPSARLGPKVEDTEPVVVKRGTEIDAGELIAKLIHAGYRREYQVEHRGELSVRGGIIDVFPSTADEGIRIDLWGDEVERLTDLRRERPAFRGRDRPSGDFGCRDSCSPTRCASAPGVLAKESPFARDVFDRIADGLTFDGMESWLPWLTDDERLFTDLLHPDARVVLVEPRRLRDRAAELIEEETSLAESLSATWLGDRREQASDSRPAEGGCLLSAGARTYVSPAGAASAPAPRLAGTTAAEGALPAGATATSVSPADATPFLDIYLHLPFDRLMSKTGAHLASVLPVADRPNVQTLAANPWAPVMGDASGLARRLGELGRSGYRVVVCADGRGSAERMRTVLESEGLDVDLLLDPTPRS